MRGVGLENTELAGRDEWWSKQARFLSLSSLALQDLSPSQHECLELEHRRALLLPLCVCVGGGEAAY